MGKFDIFIHTMSNWLGRIGAGLILVMLALSITDIIGRNLFTWPLPGSTEIISLVQGGAIALAIALTQLSGKNIRIEAFTQKLPRHVLLIIDSVIDVVLLVMFALLAWQTIVLGFNYIRVGEHSQILLLPLQYFAFIMALGYVGACLVFVFEFLNKVREIVK